ncbi:MAG: P22 phage major capsid protein family protein [Capnocytophaga sp.]|nr:P22 phage major capsid protein family protein [Capnocytophaga sp.]
MAIQKEIWMSTIVEGLFADNSFASKAFNADEFVTQGKTVHVPNAGAASGVEKNRSTFPATVSTRQDVDLTFPLDEFTTNPIRIPHAETVELSYNKRESVISQDRAKLIETVNEALLHSWFPEVANSIDTSGASVAAHTPSATGNRKLFTKADVKRAMVKFNAQNIPQTERYLLVDAEMYSQLLDSLTSQEAYAFHASVDVKNGVVGKLYGFDILMRSTVGVFSATGKKAWGAVGAATDAGVALAWHKNSVCRALGEINVFDNISDPTYYGDIYSFLVRCGGRPMRNDVKGLLVIKQASV